MGTLVGQRILGNFNVETENDQSAWLTQKAVEKSLPIPFQYGGDIAANIMLSAATRLPSTSPQKIMSMNMECVKPGDYQKVRNYHVDKLRQSERFLHALVKIVQDDQCVAVGNVAFHGTEGTEKSLLYYPPFPSDCPMPNELQQDDVILEQLEKQHEKDSSSLNYARRTVLMLHAFGLESKPIDVDSYFRLNKIPTTRMAFWMRFQEKEIPAFFNDIKSSQWSPALLGYASDFRIMAPALRQSPMFRDGKMTTLSHVMWFSPYYQLEKPNEWMLYDVRLMFSANNTCLCEGHLWNEKKQLLAITKQQGLVRPKL